MQGGDEEDVGFGRREKEELKRKSKTEIKAKSSKSILSGAYDDEVYSMQNSDKIIGKCFIFNHMTFTFGPEDRPYSELDAIALKGFFRSRGFDVTVYPDKRASQIKTILENETKSKYWYFDKSLNNVSYFQHSLT
ncbi:caspase-7 [Parasteatoda tepidariorum]|uniref:caspase-7 n=1 Tax=Parasteatoda tepidariorum TaxID=114398 RepID=UPI001C724B98|nr:uncharacterized protein LOC122268254 [Parasteatoda tepidariorum]